MLKYKEEGIMYKKSLVTFLLTFLAVTSYLQAGWEPYIAVSPKPNYSIVSIAAVDESVVWAVVDTSYFAGPANFTPIFLRTTDGGTTWKSDTIAGVQNTFLTDITALDSNTAWVIAITVGEGPNGTYKTTNGGLSWIKQTDFPGMYIHFFDAYNGVQINGDSVLITQNGGETWEAVPEENVPPMLPNEGNIFISANNAHAQVGDTIWVGTSKGRVYRSTNRGQNWTVTETSLGSNAGINSLAFQDANNGLAVSATDSNYMMAANKIARTTDGGLTWTTLTTTPQTPKAQCITYLPGTVGIYILISGHPSGPGSSFTNDEGISWQRIDYGYYRGVTFVAQNTGWAGNESALTGNNLIMYKWDGVFPSSFDQKITNKIPKNFNLYQNFPNPFNPVTKISYSLPQSGLVRLKIYNVLGQEIQTLVNKFQKAGEYNVDFEAKNLSSGIYFYKLQVGSDYVQTKKMILMR
jgi:photosystem II stability/assembly factor-like uncharacterized protein